jgi:hypothetical protein
MRGDIVYRVYGLHSGREEDSFFGAYRTLGEARTEVERLQNEELHGPDWARLYHNQGFVVREAVVDTDFEIPDRPKPRDRYCIGAVPLVADPGQWPSTRIEVFRRDATTNALERMCEYVRNFNVFETFEPFRQGDRDFALVSRDYTRTAVLDLATGEIIAEEPADTSPGAAFCPAGFHVPDWWDVHDGSVIPGSEYWSPDREWPTGQFGFVWGCHWGDDASWKVQWLDLSRIREGLIAREERFGYVELDTDGFHNPCLARDPPPALGSAAPRFIHVSRHGGRERVRFVVEMEFEVSGEPVSWQRLHDGPE